MAALIDAIDVKRKMLFEIENTPYLCLDAEVSTPTARGGQTLVRLKMRNLITRAVFDKTFKAGEKFRLASHARVREAIEQYLFEERRDVLRLVTSTARPDDDARQKISVVQERLVKEYGYDEHSAQEALNYVTTLLSQE